MGAAGAGGRGAGGGGGGGGGGAGGVAAAGVDVVSVDGPARGSGSEPAESSASAGPAVPSAKASEAKPVANRPRPVDEVSVESKFGVSLRMRLRRDRTTHARSRPYGVGDARYCNPREKDLALFHEGRPACVGRRCAACAGSHDRAPPS